MEIFFGPFGTAVQVQWTESLQSLESDFKLYNYCKYIFVPQRE